MAEIRCGEIRQKGDISLHDLLNIIRSNPNLEKGGAIVTFTGIVRGYTHEGKKVAKLEVEACKDEACKALNQICEELRKKPGILDVYIHHLVGEFFVGEDLVYVAVIAESRNQAFQILQEAVERYKKRAEIWKKEYLSDGTSYWIGE